MKQLRVFRWSKRLLLAAAALPVFQTTTSCNPLELNAFIAQDIAQNIAFSTLGVVVSGVRNTLLQFYPSADIIQTLLGGNTTQWFTG
jgi:hypothetical protein